MTSPSAGDITPIADSHCHAWRSWPYTPHVPDEACRGTIEQLIYEMDTHGVGEALLICAGIETSGSNVAYAASARDRYPARLHLVADLDCVWSKSYHTPGAAARLQALDDEFRIAGFTHYLDRTNDGWLRSEEADEVFGLAEDRGWVASLAISPTWQSDLRALAQRHPDLPILCHHLGGLTAGDLGDSSTVGQVLASAEIPSIYVKVSGFHYASARGWDFPWWDAMKVFRVLLDTFGPARLCWGSDFPASKLEHTTYRQTLEVVRAHASFLPADDLEMVLGGTLRLLLRRQSGQ